MKPYIKTLFALCAVALLSACTKDSIIYEDGIASKVYFLKAYDGTAVDLSSVADNSGNVWLTVMCAGNSGNDVTVSVGADDEALRILNIENNTSLKMLPQKYWSLETESLTMNDRTKYRTFAHLRVDFEAFEEDGIPADEYVLPLSLSTKDETLLTYQYKTLYLYMK